MGIKLGLLGLGSFGRCFAPLFANHPLVDSVVLCDAVEERIKWVAENPCIFPGKVDLKHSTTSFDELCKADVDAICIITQPELHAPQAIQAMEAGKDVYSAVPVICLPNDDEMMDWCHKIADAVKRTGKQYMLGETTFYRPQTMFCKRMAAEGKFGSFVYAEAEYAHDVDNPCCSLRQVAINRGTGEIGQQRKAKQLEYFNKGFKSHPMSYPTHSVSGVVEVMQSKPVKVSAFGYENKTNDPHFKYSDFTNIVALFKMDNQATFRVGEMREIQEGTGLCGEDFRIFGNRGSYSYNVFKDNGRIQPDPTNLHPDPVKETNVTDAEMRDPLPQDVMDAFNRAYNKDAKPGDDFVPQGHGGSHPYLVHEFVSSVAEQRKPAISIDHASTYMAMGVAAHKSAQKDGELVKVEDFGVTWK